MKLLRTIYTSLFVGFCTVVALTTNLNGSNCQLDREETNVTLASTVKIQGAGKETIDSWITYIQNKMTHPNESQAKGILGEIAATALFEMLGYDILENHSKRHIGCAVTSKRGAAGIDGIFINENFQYIFNEAKYRQRGLTTRQANNLPCADYGQQMGIRWSSFNFSHIDTDRVDSPQCKSVNFDDLREKFEKNDYMRSLTCLQSDGYIQLWCVKGKHARLNKSTFLTLSSILDINKDDFENILARELSNHLK